MSQLCRLFTGCKKEATAPASAPADAPLPPPPRALFDPVPDGVGGHAHLHLGTLQAFGAAGRLAQPLGAVAFDHADRLRAVAGDGTIWAWGLEAPAPLPMATDPAPGLAVWDAQGHLWGVNAQGLHRFQGEDLRHDLVTLQGLPASILRIAVNPSGTELVIATREDLSLYTVADGQRRWQTPHLEVGHPHFDFSPDHQHLLVVQGDKLTLLSTQDGTIRLQSTVEERLLTAAFTDDATVLVATGTGRLQSWDLSGKVLRQSAPDSAFASYLRRHPTHATVAAAATRDGAVLIIDTTELEVVARHDLAGEASDLAWSPSGEHLGVTLGNRMLRLAPLNPTPPKHLGHVEEVFAVFQPAPGRVVSQSEDRLLWWDLESGHILHSVALYDRSAFPSTHGRFWAIFEPERLHLVDGVRAESLGVLPREEALAKVETLVWRADGTAFGTLSFDESPRLRWWQREPHRLLWELELDGAVDRLEIAPEGGYLAVLHEDSVRVVDTRTGTPVLERPFDPERGRLAFAEDGRWLALTQERQIQVVDLNAPTAAAAELEMVDTVHDLAFSPGEGPWALVIGGYDTLYLWRQGETRLAWTAPRTTFEAVLSVAGTLRVLALNGDADRLALIDLHDGQDLAVWECSDATDSIATWSNHLVERAPQTGVFWIWDLEALAEAHPVEKPLVRGWPALGKRLEVTRYGAIPEAVLASWGESPLQERGVLEASAEGHWLYYDDLRLLNLETLPQAGGCAVLSPETPKLLFTNEENEAVMVVLSLDPEGAAFYLFDREEACLVASAPFVDLARAKDLVVLNVALEHDGESWTLPEALPVRYEANIFPIRGQETIVLGEHGFAIEDGEGDVIAGENAYALTMGEEYYEDRRGPQSIPDSSLRLSLTANEQVLVIFTRQERLKSPQRTYSLRDRQHFLALNIEAMPTLVPLDAEKVLGEVYAEAAPTRGTDEEEVRRVFLSPLGRMEWQHSEKRSWEMIPCAEAQRHDPMGALLMGSDGGQADDTEAGEGDPCCPRRETDNDIRSTWTFTNEDDIPVTLFERADFDRAMGPCE